MNEVHSPAYTGPDRRTYKRIKRQFMARFLSKQYEDIVNVIYGWNMVTLDNLSAGGALFNFDHAMPLSNEMDLKITFPMAREPIACEGRTTRIDTLQDHRKYRVAVKFTRINESDKELINRQAETFYSKKPGQIAR